VTGASRPAAPRPVELPRILGDIHPRPRWTETRLLLIVGVALIVGSISLGAGLTGRLAPYEPTLLVIYLLTLAGAHVANVLAGRRSDEVLLPVVGLLGGISLLLMQRLPQDLVTINVAGSTLGLGAVQLIWLVLAIIVATTLGIVVRSDPGCASTSTRGLPQGSGCCCSPSSSAPTSPVSACRSGSGRSPASRRSS
jgi:hypothetical protein